jgi:hypothetical protein
VRHRSRRRAAIDGLPGVDRFVKDFTPFTSAIAQHAGKMWDPSYFSTAWTFIYNPELLAKAGLSRRDGNQQ